MTEQTASKVPQIRFKGFEGSWDKRMLGDEPGEIIAGGDVEKHKLGERGKYPVLANALQNHGILGFYENDFRVKAPAVTVTGRGDVGHAAVRETNFTPVVRLLSVKSSHNVYFLKESINNHKVLVESTGVPQLTVPQLSKYRICFPGSIREENKIGEYFRELDSLIGMHQRKHDKLVTLKKAMLQKMFSNPGASTPEIRFKGFAGEWLEKKMGEVGAFNPKEAPPEVFEYVDLESVVGTEMVNHRTETRKTAPSRAQRLARQGDLFFQTVRPYQKNNHLFNLPFTNYVFSTGYAQIRPFNDGSFLLGLMQCDQFVKVVLDHCTGTSYPAINANVLAEIHVMIPLPEEQQKIGTYFRTIDELISKHATQLQKLQQIKSACLEKMFV